MGSHSMVARRNRFNIDPGWVAPGSVDTAQLVDGAVSAVKTKEARSGIITLTGSAQTWAHGLGGTPTEVAIIPVRGDNGISAAGVEVPNITPGSHDATNVAFSAAVGGGKVQIIARL